jgi:hypothetical protein
MSANFIRSNTIQAALVAYLKGKATLTSALVNGGAEEIREDGWKGTTFQYPNVRVDLTDNIPTKRNCPQTINVTLQVFSEKPSSLEADEIAGIITDILHDKQFEQNGLRFSLHATNVKPAYEVNETTWQSDCIMSGIVS